MSASFREKAKGKNLSEAAPLEGLYFTRGFGIEISSSVLSVQFQIGWFIRNVSR